MPSPIDGRYVAPLLITLILVIGQFSYGILESYPQTLLAIGCSVVTKIALSCLVFRKFPHQWPLAAVRGGIFRGKLDGNRFKIEATSPGGSARAGTY